MKIKIIKKYFGLLDLTEGKIYKVIEKRESHAIKAVDVLDDSGDIETLVNFDEVYYEVLL